MPSVESERGTSRRPVGKGHVVFSINSRNSRPYNTENSNDVHVYQPAVTSGLQYTYPLKLLVPEYASSSSCRWLYPITYGGGLVEGDVIHLTVTVEPSCAVLITTQASTKTYHCPGGSETRQHMVYNVGAKALLAVLPDPMVPYHDAIFSQTQVLDMCVDSNLVLLDWVSAGRVARGESWDFKSVRSSNQISINGQLVLKESVELKDSPHLSLKRAMRDFAVTGILILLGPNLEELSQGLLLTLGKPKSYDAKYGSEKLIAISPLTYTVKGIQISGCLVKFAAPSMSVAYQDLEKMLEPLYPVFGGDPFYNKS